MPESFDSAYSLILALISGELSHAFFICAILPGLGCHAAKAQAEQLVEIESRGQKIRALPVRPAQPAGSVILLAGGFGRFDITLHGCVMSLANNQLVPTRAACARAGYAVQAPDIVPDMKAASGVAQGYRGGDLPKASARRFISCAMPRIR